MKCDKMLVDNKLLYIFIIQEHELCLLRWNLCLFLVSFFQRYKSLIKTVGVFLNKIGNWILKIEC